MPSCVRLISENNIDKSQKIDYTYDNHGNILTRSVNGNIVEYGYKDGTDRLMSYGGETFAYDNMGNPTTYRNLSLTWEKGRQLAKIEGKLEFKYNAKGFRVKKTSASRETEYILDPSDESKILQERRLQYFPVCGEVYCGDDTHCGATERKIRYIYGASGVTGFSYTDANQNTTDYIYRKNLQGDVTHIYNKDGTLIAKYLYDAWGNHKILDHNGNEIPKGNSTHIGNLNPFRYRSYYYDSETNLYYLQSRYYDPEIGRFISQDDASYLSPDTINGLNLYAYCGSNPIMNIDPDGHFFFSFMIGLAVSSLVMWGLGQAFGSQIAGGIGSVVNGGGAIWTGIGLLAFGPIGIALGIGLIVVGAVTAAFGVNEIVAGATGNNAIRDWMGGGLYDGLNMGFNIASGVGQIAGNIGMRIASNRILSSIAHDGTRIANYKLWQIKTYGRYTSQYNVGVMNHSQSNPSGGYTLTHIKGEPFGYIQYHPGGGHHGPMPYWKAASQYSKTVRFDYFLKILVDAIWLL